MFTSVGTVLLVTRLRAQKAVLGICGLEGGRVHPAVASQPASHCQGQHSRFIFGSLIFGESDRRLKYSVLPLIRVPMYRMN